MQELNHHPKGEIETEASYLNATSESCQLARLQSVMAVSQMLVGLL